MMNKYNSLTEVLSAWDMLEIIGETPNKSNSILAMADKVKVAIEYSIRVPDTVNSSPYTTAYLVGYDDNGNRHTLRNQQWAMPHNDGDAITEAQVFHNWFKEKMAEARGLDEDARTILTWKVGNWLSDDFTPLTADE
jgi:hypothetical protein